VAVGAGVEVCAGPTDELFEIGVEGERDEAVVNCAAFHSAAPLDDVFSASPALVGNELILRGEKYLYCLAKQ